LIQKKQQEINIEKYKLTYEYINYGLSKTWVTKILNITIKSYNHWIKHGKKEYISKRNSEWDLVIYFIFNDYDPKYGTNMAWGHKKIAGFLSIGRKLVLNAMKEMNLIPIKCKCSYYWKRYTKEKTELTKTAPNLLKNAENEVDFSTSKPLEKICLDISEFKYDKNKCYLFSFYRCIFTNASNYILKQKANN